MARKITIEFLGNDRQLQSTVSGVEQRFGKLGGRLERAGSLAGKVLAGGLLAGGAAAVKLGQQASDLAETQSKVAQIFGEESVAALDKFASGAASSLGQSKQTALDAAATFGMFGKSAGLAGGDLVDFATDMDALAGDMASFNNTSPEEAIEAIGAALRGESEPIRKYGVLLNEATLRDEALRLGLVKTTKEALTPQQKILAAQSAILAQTADQQGDFARTSEGLANKQRILKAQMANLGAEIGAKTLPALVKLTGVGLKVVEWVEENQKLVGVLVVSLGGLLGAVWAIGAAMKAWVAISKAYTAVQAAMNVVLAANPIGLVVLAIAGLVVGLIVAYKKSETFRKIVDASFRAVAKVAKRVFGWIRDNWKKLFLILTGPVGAAVPLIIKHWGRVRDGAAKVYGWIKGNWKTLLAILTGPFGLAVLVIARKWDAIKDGARRARDAVVDRLAGIVSFVTGMPGRISSAAAGMFDGIKNAFRSAINFIIGAWNGLSFKIPGFDPPGPGPKFGGMTIGTPNIPYLAEGGIVRARTGGTLALIGEGGHDEAVVPLSGPHAPTLGGGNIIINIIGALDPVAVGRQLEAVLLRYQRSTGRPLQFQAAR